MERLRIYQQALILVDKIYALINNNQKLLKDFSINDQLKRASISVAINIAEGYCRSLKHFQNYLKISSGSANETVALLQIINLVHNVNTLQLQQEYKILGKMINAFSNNLITIKHEKSGG